MNENPLPKVIQCIETINKLGQVDGDNLIAVLVENFSFDELQCASAFFHEALKEANRRGIMSIVSDVRD